VTSPLAGDYNNISAARDHLFIPVAHPSHHFPATFRAVLRNQ
jgi:hypothetical protein